MEIQFEIVRIQMDRFVCLKHGQFGGAGFECSSINAFAGCMFEWANVCVRLSASFEERAIYDGGLIYILYWCIEWCHHWACLMLVDSFPFACITRIISVMIGNEWLRIRALSCSNAAHIVSIHSHWLSERLFLSSIANAINSGCSYRIIAVDHQ